MIHFIYGTDTFRAKQYIKQVTKKLNQNSPGDMQKIDGENINKPELKNRLQPFQLFSNQTTIILKNPLSSKKNIDELLIEYIKNPHANISLIIWEENSIDKRKSFYKTLKKQPVHITEFTLPKKFQLTQWLQEYCRQENINITPQAIQLLCVSHQNTYQLHQEVMKLKIFSDNNIQVDDIGKISHPSSSNIIFDLTDQIGRKDPKAFATAQQLINQGEYPPKLIATLGTHIANLIIIKEALDQKHNSRQIKENTKLHPFVIEKGTQQCRNFSSTNLHQIYKKIAQADINLKTGQSNFDQSIFSIINFDQA